VWSSASGLLSLLNLFSRTLNELKPVVESSELQDCVACHDTQTLEIWYLDTWCWDIKVSLKLFFTWPTSDVDPYAVLMRHLESHALILRLGRVLDYLSNLSIIETHFNCVEGSQDFAPSHGQAKLQVLTPYWSWLSRHLLSYDDPQSESA
jgi:hypothetical protein